MSIEAVGSRRNLSKLSLGTPSRREQDLARPFVTHNPELLRLLTPHLDAELTHYVDARTTGDQVKAALKRVLAGGGRR